MDGTILAEIKKYNKYQKLKIRQRQSTITHHIKLWLV